MNESHCSSNILLDESIVEILIKNIHSRIHYGVEIERVEVTERDRKEEIFYKGIYNNIRRDNINSDDNKRDDIKRGDIKRDNIKRDINRDINNSGTSINKSCNFSTVEFVWDCNSIIANSAILFSYGINFILSPLSFDYGGVDPPLVDFSTHSCLDESGVQWHILDEYIRETEERLDSIDYNMKAGGDVNSREGDINSREGDVNNNSNIDNININNSNNTDDVPTDYSLYAADLLRSLDYALISRVLHNIIYNSDRMSTMRILKRRIERMRDINNVISFNTLSNHTHKKIYYNGFNNTVVYYILLGILDKEIKEEYNNKEIKEEYNKERDNTNNNRDTRDNTGDTNNNNSTSQFRSHSSPAIRLAKSIIAIFYYSTNEDISYVNTDIYKIGLLDKIFKKRETRERDYEYEYNTQSRIDKKHTRDIISTWIEGNIDTEVFDGVVGKIIVDKLVEGCE